MNANAGVGTRQQKVERQLKVERKVLRSCLLTEDFRISGKAACHRLLPPSGTNPAKTATYSYPIIPDFRVLAA